MFSFSRIDEKWHYIGATLVRGELVISLWALRIKTLGRTKPSFKASCTSVSYRVCCHTVTPRGESEGVCSLGLQGKTASSSGRGEEDPSYCFGLPSAVLGNTTGSLTPRLAAGDGSLRLR